MSGGASGSVRACPETFGKRLGVSGNACKGSRNVWEASRKLVKSSRKLLQPSDSFGSVRQLQNLTGVAFGSKPAESNTAASSWSGSTPLQATSADELFALLRNSVMQKHKEQVAPSILYIFPNIYQLTDLRM